MLDVDQMEFVHSIHLHCFQFLHLLDVDQMEFVYLIHLHCFQFLLHDSLKKLCNSQGQLGATNCHVSHSAYHET